MRAGTGREYAGTTNDVLLATAAGGGALGAAEALWNGVQIARLAGRVDALESAMQAVISALLVRPKD